MSRDNAALLVASSRIVCLRRVSFLCGDDVGRPYTCILQATIAVRAIETRTILETVSMQSILPISTSRSRLARSTDPVPIDNSGA